MRRATSYSIIDHELLHGGYFLRLDHKSLVLYLFLVVVSDREGKSYYSERRILEILRFTSEELTISRQPLEPEGLIYYRRPYWWINNISHINKSIKPTPIKTESGKKAEYCVDRAYGKQCIHEIVKILSKTQSI